jgi:hypothetical protein
MSKPSGPHHAIVTECPEISGCTLYTSDSENTVLERELSCNGLDKFTYVAPNQYSSCHSQPLTWCSFSHVTHRYAPKASLLLAHAGVYLGMPIALHLGHVRALESGSLLETLVWASVAKAVRDRCSSLSSKATLSEDQLLSSLRLRTISEGLLPLYPPSPDPHQTCPFPFSFADLSPFAVCTLSALARTFHQLQPASTSESPSPSYDRYIAVVMALAMNALPVSPAKSGRGTESLDEYAAEILGLPPSILSLSPLSAAAAAAARDVAIIADAVALCQLLCDRKLNEKSLCLALQQNLPSASSSSLSYGASAAPAPAPAPAPAASDMDRPPVSPTLAPSFHIPHIAADAASAGHPLQVPTRSSSASAAPLPAAAAAVTSAAAASLSVLPRTLSTDDLAAISNFNVVYDTCTAASSSGEFADEWNKRKQKIISAIQASALLPLRIVTPCSTSHSHVFAGSGAG